MPRWYVLPIAVVTLAACTDDGGEVTAGGSASGSASASVAHIHEEPLPAGCELEHAIIAEVDDAVAIDVLDDGIVVEPGVVGAGVVEVRAVNDGTHPHEVTIAGSSGVVGRIVLSLPDLECTGRFELAPGDYTVRGDTGAGPVTVTVGRPTA